MLSSLFIGSIRRRQRRSESNASSSQSTTTSPDPQPSPDSKMGNAPSAPNSPKSRPAEVVRSDTLSSLFIPGSDSEEPLKSLTSGFDKAKLKEDVKFDTQTGTLKDPASSEPAPQEPTNSQHGDADANIKVDSGENLDGPVLQAVETSESALPVQGEPAMGPATAASEVRHYFAESPVEGPAPLPEAEATSPLHITVEDTADPQPVRLEVIHEELAVLPVSPGPVISDSLEETTTQAPEHEDPVPQDVCSSAPREDQPPDYVQHVSPSPIAERTVPAMPDETHEYLSVSPVPRELASQPRTPVAAPEAQSPLSQTGAAWGPGTYVLTNSRSGTALDLSAGDMKTLTGWPMHGNVNQQWEFIPCGPGYMIRAACNSSWSSGLYLALADSISEGAAVIASPFPAAWNVELLEQEQALRIRWPNSDYVLDLDAWGGDAAGTRVQLMKFKLNESYQLWRFKPRTEHTEVQEKVSRNAIQPIVTESVIVSEGENSIITTRTTTTTSVTTVTTVTKTSRRAAGQ